MGDAMKNWREIWNQRTKERVQNETLDELIMELKRRDGFDIAEGFDIESIYDQFAKMKQELSSYYNAKLLNSVFEVGCGSSSRI